jgi:3-deoxy-D-manno-octulosonic-acid transferase
MPGVDIVISTITPGGLETALALKGRLASSVFFAPFDLPWPVQRTLSLVRPDVLVLLETELWPNLIALSKRSGARVVVANGRISDRSIRKYVMMRGLFRWVLSHVDRILAQTATDGDRFAAIGADPNRVAVLGNAKFDQATEPLDDSALQSLRTELKLPEGAAVLVVGSTRTAAEERLTVQAYVRAMNAVSDLVLIHAPRHVERAGELISIMRELGLSPIRRSELDQVKGSAGQIVLDTFGELAKIYGVGDVAFIGNSLLAPGGGQNLLQPLAQGKPAIYGLYMSNFRDLAAMAESAGVGFRVSNSDELADKVVALLRDSNGRSIIAQRAQGLVRENQGASARYAEEITALLSDPNSPMDRRRRV